MWVTVERLAVAAGALGAFRVARQAFGSRGHLGAVLGALVVTVVAALVVDELLRIATRRRSGLVGRGNIAWTALGSCAVLMAVGYSGVNGRGNLGVWGPLLFSIPLLGTWYSFERLDSISRTYRQTIEALAMAPELGGVVRTGHATRVAALATGIGRELDLDDANLHNLETAALLHHIGQVTLDEPPAGTRADLREVAMVTAALLREIEPYIVMVADAYDAMTSTRSYRQALEPEVAIAELRDKAGTQFHPRLRVQLTSARGARANPEPRRPAAVVLISRFRRPHPRSQPS